MNSAVQPTGAADPLRVLLVDDCPKCRETLRRLLALQPRLQLAGEATSAAAALDLVGELVPHLVLLDIAMPKMKGIETARAIKSLPNAPRVVALSLHDLAKYREQALEAGADAYLLKADADKTLADLIDQLFSEPLAETAMLRRALQASNARFRATFEQAVVGIAHVAPDGRWLRINQTLCDMLGYSREALYTGIFHDIPHPEDLPTVLDRLRRMLSGEIGNFTLETRCRHQDGQAVWTRMMVSMVHGGEGENDFFVLMLEDIQAQRHAKERLREHEELLRAIVDGNPKGVMLLDHEARIREINPAGCALLGAPDAASVIGQALPGFISPDQCDTLHNRLGQVMRGQASHFELEIPRHEATPRHVEIHAVPLTNPTTNEALALCIALDLTEARRAEQNQRKLASAIDQAADSILITDADGYIEYVNAAFTRTTGYTQEEVIGRKPNLVRSDRHEAQFYEQLWHTISRGEVFQAVFTNRRKDGSLYHEEKSISSIKDASGAITHFVSAGKDITDHVAAREQLTYLTHYDTLTGLPNRALFVDRLSQSLIECRRHDRRLGVACIDLDRFKNINDSLGHTVGDAALAGVARRLLDAVRPGDTVARFSGDEFVVLLADMDRVEDAPLVAQRIMNAFQQPFDIDGREIYLGASIGITLYPDDGAEADPETLLQNADTALYRAKASGRGACQFYATEMTRRLADDLTLENALRHAIERGEFTLHYQPIIHLASGRITGAEALLRWQHPELGNVPPARFIPLAEECGLIVPIGEWVLRQACVQTQAWLAAGHDDLHMAVNLSPRQFRQPDLLDRIAQILAETGLDGTHLELELTEGMLLSDIEHTRSLMRQIAMLGVRFAVDDFGTGYSSLSYLKRFPIRVLKIDQSFVRDITHDADDAAIVHAIITLGHSLGMNVIAEGVETAEQLAFLCDHGCDTIQGYFFSRPDRPEHLTRLLENNGTFGLCGPQPASTNQP